LDTVQVLESTIPVAAVVATEEPPAQLVNVVERVMDEADADSIDVVSRVDANPAIQSSFFPSNIQTSIEHSSALEAEPVIVRRTRASRSV